MTLRHYKIFVTVCNTMNMTLAAEQLFMSQPAVSQAIAELEKHYGVSLFERLSRKLYLTEAGQKLLGYATHMIQMSTEIENDMKSLQQNAKLRIGASVTIGAHVLPELVCSFKRTYPLHHIEVIEDNTATIEQLIIQDKLDLGLVEGDTISPDIVNQTFMDDELTLICSPDHRLAAYSVIDPMLLEQEEFILREKGSGTRKMFEDKMYENHLNWTVSWTCNNADTIKTAVAKGLGISVISKLAITNEVKSGLLCPKDIQGITFQRGFKVIHHKNKYITEVMNRFMNFL